MPATVHGESDVPLTRKGDTILSSVGRVYGHDRTSYGLEDMGVVQCFEGNGGRLFNSTIASPPLDYESRGVRRVLLNSENHLYAFVQGAQIGSEENLLKLDISDLEATYWIEFWKVRVGDTGFVVRFEGMCLDKDENIIIVGYYVTSIGDDPPAGDVMFLWKVRASDGYVLWSTSAPLGKCHQVAVDSNNNIYLTCDRLKQVGAGNSAGCLQKYNSSGSFQWGWDSGDDLYNGEAIAISSSDEIFFSTNLAVTDGASKRWLIYVFDPSSNVPTRKLESDYYHSTYMEAVSFMKFDDEDKLYFVNYYTSPSRSKVWLHKSNTDFSIVWTKVLTSSRLTKAMLAVTFTPAKRFFLTTALGDGGNQFEIQSLRDETTGDVIWEGDVFRTIGGGYGTLQRPVFREPKLWIEQARYRAGGEWSRVPVRDSGCFIPPIYPYWEQPSGLNSQPLLETGDILFLPRDTVFTWTPGKTDQGLFKSRYDYGSDWHSHLIFQEGYMQRLTRCQSKPFQIWPWIANTSFTYGFEAGMDYKPYYINSLVYFDGVYYKCIAWDGMFHTPPNVSFWEVVPAPDPKWDSFAGFGGVPNEPGGTTPQIYTLVFRGVQDSNGVAHKLDGIYYFSKDLGRDKWSQWNFLRHRPGSQSIRGTFVMFGGITFSANTYSNPKTWMELELMWLHEVPAWSAGKTYKVGESVIVHGVDDVQKAFTCILEHSGYAPPNATYWKEQTEPWETWASTYSYLLDDFALHKGEWYKCTESSVVTLNAAGYTACVPSDIGKTVEVTNDPPPYSVGTLVDYDNDTREWWLDDTDPPIGAGTELAVLNGIGVGTASGSPVIAGGAHTDQEPPNGIYWKHVTEYIWDDRLRRAIVNPDYPGYKTVFQSNGTEDNYGCMMDWKGALNQELEEMIGQNGSASVYPGVIYQWSAIKNYVTDDIVVWNGFFYKALTDSLDSEPPSGPWTLLGHAAT